MPKSVLFYIILLFIVGVVCQSSSSLQRWNQLALSAPRSNIAAASAKNYAILAGGLHQNGSASDTVDVLDVSTRNVSKLTLRAPRYNLVATSVESYVIFAGGMETVESNETSVNTIQVLDVDTMQWTTAQFPEEFVVTENIAATSTGSLAVFFNGQMFATYDPAANDTRWTLTLVSAGPDSITPEAATAHGSIVYVSTNVLTRVLRFNAASATLLPDPPKLPDVNVVGGVRSAFVLDDNVYFASSNTLFIYDTQDNRWSITIIPFTASQGAVPIQGDIFAYKTDAQQLFTIESASWSPQNFIISINATAVTVVEDKYVVLAGGFDDGRATDALHVLEYKAADVPVTTSVPQVPVASSAFRASTLTWIGLVVLSAAFSEIIKIN